MLVKLFLIFILMLLTFGVSALSMIHGWGVQPQNWWAIGGCWGLLLLLQAILAGISESKS